MAEQQDALTLARIAQIVRRFWIVIVALTLVGAASAFLISKSQTPLYQADATVYFSISQSTTNSDLNQGSAYTQAQMLSFAQLATSDLTLERVISDLGLKVDPASLARNITVTSPQNTVLLNISVSSPSATGASEIANSVARNVSHVVVELAPTDSSSKSTVSARIVDPAVTPRVQASPNKSRDTAIGALLGLLLGILGCVIFTRLDTRLRSVEAVASVTDSPVLGQIGRLAPAVDSRPLMIQAPNGKEAESFRRARAGLRFASVDKRVRVILITSAIPAEGKTTVAVNLAVAMTENNARVLLVDADLRRPRVAQSLGLEGAVGLTTVLVDDVSLNEARRPYSTTTLDLLLSGDVPPNPSELLSSDRMAQLLTELSTEYDVVIVDSAPVLSVADATLLAPNVDLILLVVDASKARKAQLAKCIRALEVTGAHISGIVLNRMKISRQRDYYYYGEGDEESTRSRRSSNVLRPSPISSPDEVRHEPTTPTSHEAPSEQLPGGSSPLDDPSDQDSAAPTEGSTISTRATPETSPRTSVPRPNVRTAKRKAPAPRSADSVAKQRSGS